MGRAAGRAQSSARESGATVSSSPLAPRTVRVTAKRAPSTPSGSRPDAVVLRHLAVVPDARHRGHGEALVGEAARRGRAIGAAVLRIGIVAANVRLSDWYHRLGFVTVETVRYPGLVFTVDHLELRL